MNRNARKSAAGPSWASAFDTPNWFCMTTPIAPAKFSRNWIIEKSMNMVAMTTPRPFILVFSIAVIYFFPNLYVPAASW